MVGYVPTAQAVVCGSLLSPATTGICRSGLSRKCFELHTRNRAYWVLVYCGAHDVQLENSVINRKASVDGRCLASSVISWCLNTLHVGILHGTVRSSISLNGNQGRF